VDAAQAQNTYAAQWSDDPVILWASLSREFNLGRDRRLTLTANVANLQDRAYISAANNFGAPRTIKVSAGYRF
jgi:outer membrane receptor protein involved in Fe transport